MAWRPLLPGHRVSPGFPGQFTPAALAERHNEWPDGSARKEIEQASHREAAASHRSGCELWAVDIAGGSSPTVGTSGCGQ